MTAAIPAAVRGERSAEAIEHERVAAFVPDGMAQLAALLTPEGDTLPVNRAVSLRMIKLKKEDTICEGMRQLPRSVLESKEGAEGPFS